MFETSPSGALVVVRPGRLLDLLQRWRKSVAVLALLLFVVLLVSISSPSPASPPPPPSPSSSPSSEVLLRSHPESALLTDCPADHLFNSAKFQSQCSVWLSALANWKPGTKTSTYACRDESTCHGLGDRLAGIQGVLGYALQNSYLLRVEFPGLSKYFSPPPCLFTGAKDWSLVSPAKSPRECSAKFRYTCLMNQCHTSSAVVFEHGDKACLPPSFCSKAQPGELATAAQLYGCGLRLMMEPTLAFFQHPVPLHHAPMSVAQAEREMAQYFVIGIHFRIGDFALLRTREFSREERRFLVPFQCAATVQSYLENRPLSSTATVSVNSAEGLRYVKNKQGEYTVNGKPVRWFLASDSQSIRDIALDLFGDKLLLMDVKPTHIAFASASKRDAALADTLAEWYLLGKSDVLITNRIGGSSLFRGRLSSFSKYTWTYQQKHEFYDAGTCVKRNILLDGTWRVAPVACKKSVKNLVDYKNQPHLLTLVQRNLTFPEAWMDAGQVHEMVKTGGRLVKPQDDYEEEEEEGGE
ncbi:hypothetical protein BASA81_011294 [Batrachochytrium salamandrivorans]|nr:hypothetical protein BASA81_011294 [Batrachochytrium salamandrivorans]